MKYKSLISNLFLAGLICTTVACSDDDSTSKVEEGLPASLKFTMTLPQNDEILNTRASEAAESSVENVRLFFYRYETGTPVVIELTMVSEKQEGTYEDHQGTAIPTGEDNSYREYDVTIPANSGLTSGNWTVYGIANYNKQYVSVGGKDLSTLSKAEMDQFLTSGSHELDFVETGVLLSGKYIDYRKGQTGTLTLQAGENELNDPLIVLKRTVAKNVFNFTSGENITFTPTSYTVYNHSASATLMERDWKAYPTSEGFGDPGNLGYSGNDLATSNETQIESSSNGTYSFTFYCQENVQKATVTPDGGWKYNNREDHVSATDQSFKYAPANATYVVVKGNYKDADYEGPVTYTIHLGDFSSANKYDYSNFSVRRNVKYTYNVKVNGVENIKTEVDASSYPEEQAGAEGNLVTPVTPNNLILDAHYEQVLLNLGEVSKFEDTKEMALLLNTPYTDGSISLSLNSTDTEWENADIDWVEFGKPETSSTFKSYSDYFSNGTKTGLCDVKTLMTELTKVYSSTNYSNDCPHLLVSDGKAYVAAYVNEYYYSDRTSTADLKKYINADNRWMNLGGSVKRSVDEKSSITTSTIFSFSQRSIKCPFELSTTNPFGIETTEETPRATLCSAASREYERSDGATTDAGNSPMGDDDVFDGWSNTTSTLKEYGGNKVVGQKWSTLVNSAYNGYVNGTLDESNIMQSGYNYSLYQFLSRNRDLDGDDVIDEEEIRWYLPAEQQCLHLWFGYNALPAASKLSSTDQTYLTSTAGKARTWWFNEGVSFGYWKASDNYGLNSVRVIRNLKTYNGKSSEIIKYDEDTRTVTVSGLSDDCLRTYSISGNYDEHKIQESADRLPKSFQIAKTVYNNYATYSASALAEQDLGTDYSESTNNEGWRIPNEKEFGIIYQLINEGKITNISFPLGCRTTTGNSGGNYYQMLSSHITTRGASTASLYLLLVRDVTTSSSSAKNHDVSLQNGGTGTSAKYRKAAKRK